MWNTPPGTDWSEEALSRRGEYLACWSGVYVKVYFGYDNKERQGRLSGPEAACLGDRHVDSTTMKACADRHVVRFRDVLEDEVRPARFGEVEVLSFKTDRR